MKDYKSNYDLGIIGGMGSEATVEFFRRIVDETYHEADQDFMRICVLNDSIIPDRTKSILEGSNLPLDYINSDIERLESLGVNYFVIPCNTAHYYKKGFKNTKVKFISMVDEAVSFIKDNYPTKQICVLSTNGTIATGVYHNLLEENNLKIKRLEKELQDKVMEVITLTKQGRDKEANLKKLVEVIEKVNDKDVLFLLACTELSLYKERLNKYLVVDAMDIVVKEAITKCGYKLKEEK